MARQLQMLLNVGHDDQKRYGIPNGPDGDPPKEGDVVSVSDDTANVLVNVLKCAKDYDAKEEAEREAKAKEAAVQAVSHDVSVRLAKEEAEKEATSRLKNPKKDFAADPHTDAATGAPKTADAKKPEPPKQ